MSKLAEAGAYGLFTLIHRIALSMEDRTTTNMPPPSITGLSSRRAGCRGASPVPAPVLGAGSEASGRARVRKRCPLRSSRGVQGAQPPPGVQRVPLFPKTLEGGLGGTTAQAKTDPPPKEGAGNPRFPPVYGANPFSSNSCGLTGMRTYKAAGLPGKAGNPARWCEQSLGGLPR